MAYTVKQVASMSGVSVRTLHFYDETRLLKPAYLGANGYRFYEEAQLLTLQQILFYRELGFELREIKRILGRRDFEKVAALQSHRTTLQKKLSRMRRLIETVDKTIQHLKGTKKMKNEEMFAGFVVAAGSDRFNEQIKLGGEPVDCKVSSGDTQGAMSVFESTFGWPHHFHENEDEWIYVVDGEWEFQIGKKKFRAGAGQSIFVPRKIPHLWGTVDGAPGRIIHVFQPAGNMEAFFRKVGMVKDLPTREQVIHNTYTDDQINSLRALFAGHGMKLLAPPPGWLEPIADGESQTK